MRDNRKSSVGPWIIAGMVTLLGLYVASFVCVGWMANHRYLPESVLKPMEGFYLPIKWIAEQIEPIKSFLMWLFTLGS